MDPAEWMKTLKALHEQAKRKELNEQQLATYAGMREELARSLCAAQKLTVQPGQMARETFRVAHAFALEINNVTRTMTRDISKGGFSCLLPQPMKDGEEVSFALTVNRAEEPVTGVVKVIASVRLAGNARVSFAYAALSKPSSERLETALFDAVLSRF